MTAGTVAAGVVAQALVEALAEALAEDMAMEAPSGICRIMAATDKVAVAVLEMAASVSFIYLFYKSERI